jgi:hypothetical protein
MSRREPRLPMWTRRALSLGDDGEKDSRRDPTLCRGGPSTVFGTGAHENRGRCCNRRTSPRCDAWSPVPDSGKTRCSVARPPQLRMSRCVDRQAPCLRSADAECKTVERMHSRVLRGACTVCHFHFYPRRDSHRYGMSKTHRRGL